MSTVVLIQAQPRYASGAAVDIRLAGGGTRPWTQLGFNDWRGGVANLPRFTSAVGFEQAGFTGGALPQTAGLRFFPSDKAFLSALGNLMWQGARIVVTTGDDEAVAPVYTTQLVGTVAAIKTEGGAITFTISDLSVDLDKPVCPDTFAGTGDLEGGDDATGRVKRRSWGRVFNVEGRVLDKAYNIYEFGDPARPWQSFDMVKDKGRAGDTTVLAWQGTAIATLNALRNATAPSGGAVVAPSIACVKWWTRPSGPLTADIRGEVGAGYVETVAEIAARIASVYSTSITVGNVAEAVAWQGGAAGIHAADAGETVGNVLDRLLPPVSILWGLDGAGVVSFRRATWSNPVEALIADTISRDTTFQPLKTRRLGFQINNRQHSDAEISAALLLATDATYADGTPIETLKPAEAGANVTEQRTAAAINGQGAFATANTAGYGSPLLTGFGQLSPLNNVYFGSSYLLENSGGVAATLNAFKTALGQAASIFGQGSLATLSKIVDGYLDGALATRLTPFSGDANYLAASQMAWDITGGTVQSLKPGEAGANVTEIRTAAAIYGQGPGATAAAGAVLNSAVAKGANLLPNSDQTGPNKTWVISYNPASTPLDTFNLAIKTWGTDTYALSGRTQNVAIHQINRNSGGDLDIAVDLGFGDANGNLVTITAAPGDRFIFSLYIATHRCFSEIYAYGVKSDGSLFTAWESGALPPTGTTTNILASPNYNRHKVVIDNIPAGTVGLRFFVRKYNTATGQSDSYMWWAAPMIERASALQTEPSPYVAGPAASPRDLGYSGELDATNTGRNTAAAIFAQGALATLSAINDSYLSGTLATRLAPFSGDPNYLSAGRMAWDGTGGTVQSLKPGEPNANVTEGRTAAAIVGQAAWATLQVTTTRIAFLRDDGTMRLGAGNGLLNEGATAWLYDQTVITIQGTSAAISGQGQLATQNNVTGDQVVSGVIRNSDATVTFDLSSATGIISRTKGSVRLMQGNGFGSAGNLIEWFGPSSIASGQETSANAYNARLTDGGYVINTAPTGAGAGGAGRGIKTSGSVTAYTQAQTVVNQNVTLVAGNLRLTLAGGGAQIDLVNGGGDAIIQISAALGGTTFYTGTVSISTADGSVDYSDLAQAAATIYSVAAGTAAFTITTAKIGGGGAPTGHFTLRFVLEQV